MSGRKARFANWSPSLPWRGENRYVGFGRGRKRSADGDHDARAASLAVGCCLWRTRTPPGVSRGLAFGLMSHRKPVPPRPAHFCRWTTLQLADCSGIRLYFSSLVVNGTFQAGEVPAIEDQSWEMLHQMDDPKMIDSANPNGSHLGTGLKDTRPAQEKEGARKGYWTRRQRQSDWAFIGGLFGEDYPKDLEDEIRNERQELIDAKQAAFELGREGLQARLDRLKSYDERLADDERRNLEMVDEVSAQLQTIGQQLDQAKAEMDEVARTILCSRANYASWADKKRSQEWVERVTRLDDEDRVQLEFENRRLAADRDRRKANQSAYDNRRRRLEQERNTTDTELRDLEERFRYLQESRVTRNVADSLVVGGSLGLAGLGWCLGEILRRAEASGPTGAAITAFSERIAALEGQIGVLGGILTVILGTALVTALTACIVLLIHWIGRPRPPVSISHIGPDFRARWLARVPVLYGLLLVPALYFFAISQSSRVLEPAAALFVPALDGALLTLVGLSICAVIAGLALLITVRHKRKPVDGAKGRRGLSALETISLCVAAVLVLVEAIRTTTQTGSFELFSLDNAVLVMILVVPMSFVLAHGVIFRGYYKERRQVRKRRAILGEEIDALAGYPTVRPEPFEKVAARRRTGLRAIDRQLDRIWGRSAIIKPLEPGKSKLLPPRLERRFRLFRGRMPTGLHPYETALTSGDGLFSADKVASYRELFKKVGLLAKQLEDVQAALAEHEREGVNIRRKGLRIEEGRKNLHSDEVDLITEHPKETHTIERRYRGELDDIKNAYRLGKEASRMDGADDLRHELDNLLNGQDTGDRNGG